MKDIKRIIAAIAMLLSVLPSYSQEKKDSVYEFSFVPGKNQFFSPYKNNETELDRLMKCIELNKETIVQDKIFVDGYCNSLPSKKRKLHTAKIRSNKVKSYLITNAGLTEDCFITKNHAEKGDFVILRMYVPAPAIEEKDVAEDNVVAAAPVVAAPEKEDTTIQVPEVADETEGNTLLHRISLRTNLLRLATLTPDLGIELQLADGWSVVVDGSWTSWCWDNKNRRYALWEVSPEVRYYLSSDNKLYLGAQYKIGEFNYKLSGTGKQGDLQGGGVTFGYKLPFGKAFALDFNAAAGCLHTDYKTYQVIDGVRVREAGHTKNVWGITDLGVTLVWKLK